MTADLEAGPVATRDEKTRPPAGAAAPHAVVEEFLTELRETLIELTEQQRADAQRLVRQVVGSRARRRPTPTASDPAETVGPGAVTLAAIAGVALGWALLFWIKASSPGLALTALLAANVTACSMLWSRRRAT